MIAAAVMASSNVPIEQPVGRLSTRRTLLIRPSLASCSLSRNGVPSLLSSRLRSVLSAGESRFMSAVREPGREPVAGDLTGNSDCETVIGVRGGCSVPSSGSLFHGRMVSPTPASRSANGSSPPTCAKGVAWMGPDV